MLKRRQDRHYTASRCNSVSFRDILYCIIIIIIYSYDNTAYLYEVSLYTFFCAPIKFYYCCSIREYYYFIIIVAVAYIYGPAKLRRRQIRHTRFLLSFSFLIHVRVTHTWHAHNTRTWHTHTHVYLSCTRQT